HRSASFRWTRRRAARFSEQHLREHSLEVQLPFLQVLLGDEVSVLPIVTGDATAPQVTAALERVWGGDETLIIISSDLSHYLDYARARAVMRSEEHTSELQSPYDL